MPDDVPPAAPIGLKAVVDSAGVVSISWSRNSEPDIFAYRVYCSNTGREDDYFTIRGSYIKDTFVADTLPLNTLDKFKFYKVTAIDRSYNESDFSPAVRATKPDTIPPTAAAFRLPRQEKGEVIVEWSVARTPDATELLLFRQIGDTGKVELVKRYDLQKKEWPSSYHDSRSYSGEIVQYFITIKDEAGNEAKSASARLATEGKRKGCLKELKHLVVCDEKEHKITLHWQHDEDNLTRIVVYRKKDDGRTLPIASVRASDTTYEDKEVAIGSTFTYVIRAVSSERVCPAIYSDPITFDGLVK